MNKFWNGVLTGLAGALVILLLVFVLTSNGLVGRSQAGTGDGQATEPTAGAQPTGTEADAEAAAWDAFQYKLNYIEDIIERSYLNEVTDEALTDGIFKGLMSALKDPYAGYLTKDELTRMMEASSGVYCGIGTYVSQNLYTGIITIVKPFVNSPAHLAGLLPGDILYQVGDIEVTGMDLTEVVSHIKGEEGTYVEVTVAREGEDDYLTFSVMRAEVEVPTVTYEMLEESIGYIQVTEFDEITIKQFSDAVTELTRQGMQGLIIDLRDNPGGLLDAAVEMLDRLLPPGLLVYTEDKNGKRDEEYADDQEAISVPLVLLMNGDSASASEIFGGAVQDYGIGKVVGTQSYGKGIVQNLIPLYDGTAIKLTVSEYFTPKGRAVHGVGITPDVVVELDEEASKKVVLTHEEDNQLQTAIETLLSELAHAE